MEEIEKLKMEIRVLNKRIAILEGKENRRNAFKGIKLVIKIIFLLAILYGIWYVYDYATNYIPNQIEKGINDLIPESLR